MSNLGAALGWKYNHAPGIMTKGNIITRWPSGLGSKPNAAAKLAIIAEYDARDKKEEVYQRSVHKRARALELVCAEQFGMTPAQMKTAIKAKM